MLAAALMEEEETDEDEGDDVDEGIELMNKLKAAGLEDAAGAKGGKKEKPTPAPAQTAKVTPKESINEMD